MAGVQHDKFRTGSVSRGRGSGEGRTSTRGAGGRCSTVHASETAAGPPRAPLGEDTPGRRPTSSARPGWHSISRGRAPIWPLPGHPALPNSGKHLLAVRHSEQAPACLVLLVLSYTGLLLQHPPPSTSFRLVHRVMSSTTPVTADFSSPPLKRSKIVLLGDQSVGKTSLITRCAQYTPVPDHALPLVQNMH